MTHRSMVAACGLTLLAVGACNRAPASGGTAKAGEASAATTRANAAVAQSLPLNDTLDMADAKRGLVARPAGRILRADSTVAVDFDALKFIEGAAPATVNPSLWRHAQLDAQVGLFKVTDGIWQLRGFDLANMTLIEGATGWIVVDPLTVRETSAAALAFARQQLGNKPVSAVIFSHSHIDHFGGVLGVLSAADARTRNVPIVAPQGFMEEATSENVMVGTAMGRRATYQFGSGLAQSATGRVSAGLGTGVARGTYGILAPTVLVSQPTQEITLDGVRFVFHNTPGAEAPAELTFSLPDKKAYCSTELVQQTMHNLLPIRGAKVRDALQWSRYLDLVLAQSADAQVLFAQHSWPTWGHARIAALVTAHRDVYKYTHDQSVRALNAGQLPAEIAEEVTLPPSLQGVLGSRGYYGAVRHNAKAVYQFYLGAYDGNPAHLDPLPPEESAKRYVALFGGAPKAIAAAQEAFERGEYRWATELLNHVIFADGANRPARDLLARAYEQLGYQAESATWRNAYLTGAAELRGGAPARGLDRSAMLELLNETPVERFLDAMAASLDGPGAVGKALTINLVLSDTRESHVLWIENAVLHHKAAPPVANANASLTLTKPFFVRMMAGTAGAKDLLLSSDVKVTGSKVDLARFFGLLTKAPGTFGIVTPE